MSHKSENGVAPSWDEFDVEQEELDYEEEKVCEPNISDKYEPSLPPRLATNEDGNLNNFMSDFAVLADSYDEPDDPEDPTQLRFSKTKRDTCMQFSEQLTNTSQKNNLNGSDESFNLPSISSTSDVQIPSTSCQIFGPCLPSEFFATSSKSGNYDLDIKSSLPPDEPHRQNKNFRTIGPLIPNEFFPTVAAATSTQNNLNTQSPNKLSVIGPILPFNFCDSTSDEAEFETPNRSINGKSENSNELDQNTSNSVEKSQRFMELPLEDEENSNGVSNSTQKIENGIQHLSKLNNEDDDEDIIGPSLPPSMTNNGHNKDVENEYFQRLLKLEAQKAQKDLLKSTQREEWMVELPQKLKQSYGLSSKTTFSKTPATNLGDSNLWTDTPGSSSSASKNIASISTVVNQTEQTSKKSTQKEVESLLDLHQRKRKLDNNEASSSSDLIVTRRPFNRDFDMEVRGFSNMTSEEIKNKMGDLNNRFQASSSTKKFL